MLHDCSNDARLSYKFVELIHVISTSVTTFQILCCIYFHEVNTVLISKCESHKVTSLLSRIAELLREQNFCDRELGLGLATF